MTEQAAVDISKMPIAELRKKVALAMGKRDSDSSITGLTRAQLEANYERYVNGKNIQSILNITSFDKEDRGLPNVPKIIPDFYFTDQVKKSLSILTQVNLEKDIKCVNVAFRGPTGVGKTTVAEQFAAHQRIPFVMFDCAKVSDPDGFAGNWHVKQGTMEFRKTELVNKLMEYDEAVILLDEVNRVQHPQANNTLLEMLDDRRSLNILQTNEHILFGHKRFYFFLTWNEGSEYIGTTENDAALQNRIAYTFLLEYLEPKAEQQLLMSRYPNIDKGIIVELVKVANHLRPARNPISLRQLQSALEFVSQGMSLLDAIMGTFSSVADPSEINETCNAALSAVYRQRA